jgi:hypothetical protein
MLGRTRPASRILLWPRSKTRAARFTTTASADSSHEAAAEYQFDDPGNDVSPSPLEKKTFKGIRRFDTGFKNPAVLGAGKFTIRRMVANTEPAIPQDPWAKLEEASGKADNAPTKRREKRLEKRWAPISKAAAKDDPWDEKRRLRHPVHGGGRPERASRTVDEQNKIPGNWGRPASVEIKSMAPSGEWKPFSPNPDLVAKKSPSPAHLPTPISPSTSSPQKKDFEKSEAEDGAPPRSEILGEMRGWSFEEPPTETAEQAMETPEPPSGESHTVVHDDGAPRSKIIEEMRAWNYVPPVTKTDAGEQEITSQTPPGARGKIAEELPPLDSKFRKWLKQAIKTAVRKAELDRPLTNGVAVYDGPAVLVLNAASQSLLESDFYRLAGQGKHLGDWPAGIARIIQACDPATYEPLGKYYIFFHTRAAALAYSEDVWRLHLLSRRAAELISTSSSSSDNSIPGPLPLAPTAATQQPDLDAALRGYTLLPHSTMLYLKLHLCKDLPPPEKDEASSVDLYLGLSSWRDVAQEVYFVLVNLEGCKATIAALQDAITRDGEQRRLPWGLATRGDGKPHIAAVMDRGSDEAAILWGTRVDGDSATRFWRFIVPFTEAVEARRFVRNWHRREMQDLEGRNMVVTFNVTALWWMENR